VRSVAQAVNFIVAGEDFFSCRDFLRVLLGHKSLNAEFAEVLCALCVGALDSRRSQRTSLRLRPKATLG
jgi:hypothetical protein